MSAWENFLADDGLDPTGKPGKVMICLMNRFLEGLDGVKYKFVLDGKMSISGTTTEEKFCIEFAPSTFIPIETYVWSFVGKRYKKLDDVVPKKGRKLLIFKRLNTFKVLGRIEEHPKNPKQAPPPEKPVPAPPPGSSPTGNQGTQPTPTKQDETTAQLGQYERPVPGQITKEQLKKVFTDGSLGDLQKVADICNKDLAKYKLDTPFRRAHFFGQVRQEAGPGCDRFVEILNYSPTVLKNKFSYYKNHPLEADEDGYHFVTVKGKVEKIRAKKETIANKAYGTKPKANELGNTQVGDGWRFRGRGLKQLTGRSNYSNFSQGYSEYFDVNVDFEKNPDLVAQLPYAVHSAIWFWLANNCYENADQGINDAAIDAVTQKINSGESDKNKLHRRQFVKLAYNAFV